jgi:hypothetical protein
MVVSTKSKSKEATSQTSALTTHTSKKITEMIIVAVIVLLMVSVGLFITQVYGGGDNTVVNNLPLAKPLSRLRLLQGRQYPVIQKRLSLHMVRLRQAIITNTTGMTNTH